MLASRPIRRALAAAFLALTPFTFAGCDSNDEDNDGEMATPNAQNRAVLDALAALGARPGEGLTPEQARTQPSVADAVRAVLVQQGRSTAPEPVGSTADRTIPGPGGTTLPVRVYTPAGTAPVGGWPLVVYFHGGGWVIATIDTYDSSARALTNAARAVVLSVEYRKGPENKFPAAHDDANASYAWALANAASVGANAAKIAVAGESAGGNLAANVPLYAKANGLRLPVHQLLVYPIAGSDFDTESYVENANAMPLSRAGVLWFGERYFRSPADAQDPRINLVGRPLTDLAGLPTATVIGAEIDPLRSEGRAYADRLDDADVRVRYRLYKRVTHEFFGTGAVVKEGREAVAYAAEGLRASFAD